MQEACFWDVEQDENVRCRLCPHQCLIPEGHIGICRVRINKKGKLYSLVYGHVSGLHVDPVEKKPLYHFFPGGQILSVGTKGCTLHCSFCQNHTLSQGYWEVSPERHVMTPALLAEKASIIGGNIGIAYTYNEPVVFYEFMMDTCRLVHRAGMKNVVVSNGFINPAPLEKLLLHADAFNIDLKSFEDGFYRKVAGGALTPVLNTLKRIARSGRHLEITWLLIPGLNDSPDLFEKMTNWIAEEVGDQVPLHISRYFPAYQLDVPATPVAMMERFHELACRKLRWVYSGNISDEKTESSWCPDCKALLIKRDRYSTELVNLEKDGKCSRCGTSHPFILQNTAGTGGITSSAQPAK